MFKRFLFIAIVLISIALNAEQFRRIIEERIEVNYDGSAIITRTESIEGPAFSKLYNIYFQQFQKDKTLFKNLYYELTKEYYFLYGTTPSFTANDFEISFGDHFKWTVKMKADGFLSYENKQFVLRRKGFNGDEKLAALLLPKYFENELDEKLFISAFLGSEKNYLETTRVTEVILPEGSNIEKLAPALPTQKETGNTWRVDFGGQNSYKATLEKTSRGYVLKQIIYITGGAPKNLLDQKQSINVLSELRDYAAFQCVFFNEKIKPDTLTKPLEHKVKNDFSGSWGFSVSSGELFSYTFTYGTLSVTPKTTVTLTFNVSLLWEHEWVKTGWFSWSYRFKKFETVVSFSPSLKPSLEVSSGGSIEKSWSKNLATKTKTVTLWVSGVPVVLVLEAKLDAEAMAKIYGSIGFNLSATYTFNTSLGVTYENGSWRQTPSYSTK
ncbi:hypothetical protein ACSFC1_04400 [Pseudothermotoga sp. U03pept]|uniref:hypothetical protein n=1 Tax=Pseudothermotoga sp. U03pept TaxID=3447012 RepID=UPI003F0EDD39